MDSFNKRLKELRLEQGASTKELSEYLGIKDRTYRYYESGERRPDFEGLIALANYFDVSVDYLIGRSDIK